MIRLIAFTSGNSTNGPSRFTPSSCLSHSHLASLLDTLTSTAPRVHVDEDIMADSSDGSGTSASQREQAASHKFGVASLQRPSGRESQRRANTMLRTPVHLRTPLHQPQSEASVPVAGSTISPESTPKTPSHAGPFAHSSTVLPQRISVPTRTIFLPVILSADANVKPEVVSFATALKGHTLHKASILRAAELEHAAQSEPQLTTFFEAMPVEVEQAADNAFSHFFAQTTTDARYYLRPDKYCTPESKALISKVRRNSRRQEEICRRMETRNKARNQAVRRTIAEQISLTKEDAACKGQSATDDRGLAPAPKTPGDPTHPSRLTGLPPELRNRIYSLALTDTAPINLTAESGPARLPSLLHVSRQIRLESLPLYFAINDFVATIKDANTAYICRWLDMIGTEGGSNLRRMEIRCSGRCKKDFVPREAAVEHYFVALTKCLSASSVCRDAVEIRSTFYDEHNPYDLQGNNIADFASIDLWQQTQNANDFHRDVQGYMRDAGYPPMWVAQPCRSCRGRNHVSSIPLTASHVLGEYHDSYGDQRALPFLLPKSHPGNALANLFSPLATASVYKACICRATASSQGTLLFQPLHEPELIARRSVRRITV